MSALLLLGAALGILQYRWIGEVSVAERERLQRNLQTSLTRFSQDFNSEITAACVDLLPLGSILDESAAEKEFVSRYTQWRAAQHNGQFFRRVAILTPRNGSLALRLFDPEKGEFESAEWPAEWTPIKTRLDALRRTDPRRGSKGLNPGLGGFAGPQVGLGFALPLMGAPPQEPSLSGGPGLGLDLRETGWVVFDLNDSYIREAILPQLLLRDLGSAGTLDYQVEIVTKTSPPSAIYQSDPDPNGRIRASADGSVGILDIEYDLLFRRMVPAAFQDRGAALLGPLRALGPDLGRWQMFVRHRAGSLEAVVSRTRVRNSAVTAGILLLMMLSVAALIRYTRREQKLAKLQMDFVAGVSHELRTPLTAIYTAAYNLRKKVVREPDQIEEYGAMIQEESGRLRALVEQVLQFASASAGRVVQESKPLSVQAVIEQAVEASRQLMRETGCKIEESIEPGLPLISGDPAALQQALQNLLSNAAKYGSQDDHWIGIFASKSGHNRSMVEIRVADRGPGIPADEQEQIFDPFFRGRRALQDQVHGTGLGLNLVKKIVEAHKGSVRVRSEPTKGTEFIVCIPAAPPNHHEFADSVSRG